jgi:SpoIID/LytB domain protein
MRRPLALLSVAVLVSVTAPSATGHAARRWAPPPGTATFVVTGHGWGHGVGLSQYGAYGYAQHGYAYDQILAHYFPGTELGPAPVSKVRVLLASGASTLKLGSADAFTVRDGSGAVHDVAAGTYTVRPALKLKVDGATKAKALVGPLVFLPGASPLQLGRRYRGSIQIDTDTGKLRAINVVGLEQYLYGVVPSEMPFDWAPQALEAQAVAARSYALATKRSGAFDLYPDTRSQVYLGIDHEKPSTTEAVDATAGQVLLFDGAVAKTYFFSTSGGRTASSQDVWGTAIPYLVSVPDPYDSISPYHTWGPYPFSGAKLGRMLHAGGPVLDAQTTRNASGRVTQLDVLTSAGQKTFDGSKLRSLLGLRSTWFTMGVLSLAAPGTPVAYGTSAQLAGVARGVGAVTLQQLVGGAWQPVGKVTPAKDGTLAVAVAPRLTTSYRLATGKVAATAARVRVAPLVRLLAPRLRTDLRGTARPATPGVVVAIQRRNGNGAWGTVATTTVDAGGAFDARFQLTDGDYRARIAPGHGLVPGYSPILQVSTS